MKRVPMARGCHQGDEVVKSKETGGGSTNGSTPPAEASPFRRGMSALKGRIRIGQGCADGDVTTVAAPHPQDRGP